MAFISKSNFGNFGPGANAVTISAVSAASRIIVALWTNNTTAPTSIMDNGSGNTYTLDFSFAGNAAGATEKFWFYSCNAPAGSPTQVTVDSASNNKFVAYAYSEIPSSSFL